MMEGLPIIVLNHYLGEENKRQFAVLFAKMTSKMASAVVATNPAAAVPLNAHD